MEDSYLIIKDIHFYIRWVILALAVVVLLKYLAGWFGKQKFAAADNQLSLFFVTAMDIQLLLGLLLYFFLSPYGMAAFQHEDVMSTASTRLYAVEHPLTMFIAIIFAHVGRVMVKKSPDDSSKFKKGCIFFGLALIFMLSRMPL